MKLPRHEDFEGIYQGFIKRLGLVEGYKSYYAWLSRMGLDENKPRPRPEKSVGKAKFTWDFIGNVELTANRPVPIFRLTAPLESKEEKE